MSLTAEQITSRLEAIDADLEARQPELERATTTYFRLDRDLELRLAKGREAAVGPTQTQKRDQALIAVAAADDDLYVQHGEAKASFVALKAVVKVLETRVSIAQSWLKFQRETGG